MGISCSDKKYPWEETQKVIHAKVIFPSLGIFTNICYGLSFWIWSYSSSEYKDLWMQVILPLSFEPFQVKKILPWITASVPLHLVWPRRRLSLVPIHITILPAVFDVYDCYCNLYRYHPYIWPPRSPEPHSSARLWNDYLFWPSLLEVKSVLRVLDLTLTFWSFIRYPDLYPYLYLSIYITLGRNWWH